MCVRVCVRRGPLERNWYHIILTKSSSMSEVIIMTTSGAASDEDFVKMKTCLFQYVNELYACACMWVYVLSSKSHPHQLDIMDAGWYLWYIGRGTDDGDLTRSLLAVVNYQAPDHQHQYVLYCQWPLSLLSTGWNVRFPKHIFVHLMSCGHAQMPCMWAAGRAYCFLFSMRPYGPWWDLPGHATSTRWGYR